MSQPPQTSSSIQHSAPIPIGRPRGESLSSDSSTSSGNSPITPSSSSFSSSPAIASSPLLSLFMGSPTSKPSTGFPFKHKFGSHPVFEEEEELPVANNARRASTMGASARITNTNVPEGVQEGRGANILRRLSLSTSGLARPVGRSNSPPAPPPNSAVTPTAQNKLPFPTRHGRSATVSGGRGLAAPADAKNKRAPSPTGERILRGSYNDF